MKYIVTLLLTLTACTLAVKGAGPAGKDGEECIATKVPLGILISCADDTVLIPNPKDGVNGATGPQGEAGKQGTAGESCTVVAIDPGPSSPTGGASINCPNSNPVIVFNGAAGADAAAYTSVEAIDPCGSASNEDEVLIRMADGALVRLYAENGNATRAKLITLQDNVLYTTNDTQRCVFSLSTLDNNRTMTTNSPINSIYSWEVY